MLQFNNYIELKIDHEKKSILIKQKNKNGLVLLKNGKLNNWNIFLNIKGLKFSPENVGKQHVDGQGHAHVFVDGVKHGRMYSNWYHLGSIDFGSKITVTLNSNNHKAFIKAGELVEVTHLLTK